jgi:hypothetical protein
MMLAASTALVVQFRPTLPYSTALPRWSDTWMLAEGQRYLTEPQFRRSALIASLANPTNSYSRQRLESYGLQTRGWDTLPVWNPRSAPVSTQLARNLAQGTPVALADHIKPLWDGRVPNSMTDWIALGRAAFFGYPLRAEVFMTFALQRPELAERVGVRSIADGTYPGLRLFVDVDGSQQVGITCAICHTQIEAGRLIVGAARRSFDYGALRLEYHRATGVPIDSELAARMARWGPGRADVTEDEAEDPVAIPDLWGLRTQTALTQAGTLHHLGPTALAIRQETQLLHSNHQRIRPPREIAWALAMFLYSLRPPPGFSSAQSPAHSLIARGEALFQDSCRGCHSNAAFGGEPVAVARVGTDPALALGGARGTGFYRPPVLLHVGDAAPYLHHGAVPSLEDLFSPDRLAAKYHRSPLGPGPVGGHVYGTDWPEPDRAALVAFLRTL